MLAEAGQCKEVKMLVGGHSKSGRGHFWFGSDWIRSGGMGWDWHLTSQPTPIPCLICLTWATWFCSSKFAGADLSSPIGWQVCDMG